MYDYLEVNIGVVFRETLLPVHMYILDSFMFWMNHNELFSSNQAATCEVFSVKPLSLCQPKHAKRVLYRKLRISDTNGTQTPQTEARRR